jgi:hypothetical protein
LHPRAGGCFCEVLPNLEPPDAAPRGGAEHMRVVYAEDARVLRMIGALGPMQSEAVTGVLTIVLNDRWRHPYSVEICRLGESAKKGHGDAAREDALADEPGSDPDLESDLDPDSVDQLDSALPDGDQSPVLPSVADNCPLRF